MSYCSGETLHGGDCLNPALAGHQVCSRHLDQEPNRQPAPPMPGHCEGCGARVYFRDGAWYDDRTDGAAWRRHQCKGRR